MERSKKGEAAVPEEAVAKSPPFLYLVVAASPPAGVGEVQPPGALG